MITQPPISRETKPAHKFLWAVKTYLDLISRNDPLVPGAGLKRLYVMSSGISTFNESDIEGIVAKAERLKILPMNLYGFMISAVLKNCFIYGKELQAIINGRILDIANGRISNPAPTAVFDASRARREFYVPPATLIKRIDKALRDNYAGSNFVLSGSMVTQLQDVANDADLVLSQMQGNEGFISNTESSWGALANAVNELTNNLERESLYGTVNTDYRRSSRSSLKILWVIAKILMGDLTIRPKAEDMGLVDLDKSLSFTDGTLAAIPFPLQETARLFSDNDGNGVTMKGRMYLSAVSNASVYRSLSED